MRRLLQKLLNLRPEEVLPASSLFLYLFLVMVGYIMGQSIGDSLFLSAFGDYLPQAIMGMGLLVGILVAVYIRVSRHVSLERLVVGCLLVFAFSFAVCWWFSGWNKSIAREHGAVRRAGIVTVITALPHGLKPGDRATIYGVAKLDKPLDQPVFNGSFVVRSVPSSTEFTYEQAGPDAESGSGTVSFSMLFTGVLYSLIFLLVYSAGALGPTMGWTLANFMLTTREARRVFGFVGAGAVLGGIAAGFLTRGVISLPVRPEFLLFLVAVAYVLCAVVVKFVFRSARQRLAEMQWSGAAGLEAPRNFLESARLLRSSRYLLLITALVFVGCVVTTIIGYQFKMIAAARFTTKAELASFFGTFYAWVGLASFVLQLVLTGRLLRSVGIRVTLFVLPVLFMFGTGLLLAVGTALTLLAACVLKGSQNLVRYSLDKSSAELLYLPVAPEVKSQVKSFIDTFVWRMADGVAGLFLLVLKKLGFTPSRMGAVNLVFLGLWVVVAYGVKREYLTVLRRAIERRTLDPERTGTALLDATTTEVLLLQLQGADEQQILYRLSLFKMGAEAPPRSVLRHLLGHEAGSVRAYALRMLGDSGDTGIVEQAEKMLGDPSTEVRAEATHYLVVHTGRDPLNLLEAIGAVPPFCLQGAVATYLLGTDPEKNLHGARHILKGMLAETGPDRARSRAEAARVLAIAPPFAELHFAVVELLQDPDPSIGEQALVTAGKIADRSFLPLVIEKLGNRRLLAAARAALLQYGDRALGTLQDYLDDLTVPLPVRKQIPGVLARMGTPEACSALMNSLVQSEPGLRFDILQALNRLNREGQLSVDRVACEEMIQAELMGLCRSLQIVDALEQGAPPAGQRPGAELLLVRASRERMEFELERIFRLLALIYPARDIHNAYVGLRSSKPVLQANALEVLEHILPSDLYRPLSCLLDPEIEMPEKVMFAERLCHVAVLSKAEALRIHLHSLDKWLVACATYAVGRLCLAELAEDVRRIPESDDRALEEVREWTLARLATAASG
jgi:AAA family ATP:ADP antiporter